jgi:hypothetical protein
MLRWNKTSFLSIRTKNVLACIALYQDGLASILARLLANAAQP